MMDRKELVDRLFKILNIDPTAKVSEIIITFDGQAIPTATVKHLMFHEHQEQLVELLEQAKEP